jgi:hypothetical protein
MFKSTKEFDIVSYKILVNFRDGKFNPAEYDLNIDETDLNDALQRVVDLNCVKGISYTQTMGGLHFQLMNPRITYDGLAFIEKFDAQSHQK